jgi:hypothetical protein
VSLLARAPKRYSFRAGKNGRRSGLNISNLQAQKNIPFRAGSVFSVEKGWFPIVVAIEHENACAGFESEVMKLFSVRCPLKVGIVLPQLEMEKAFVR